jgi:hypothetical protein
VAVPSPTTATLPFEPSSFAWLAWSCISSIFVFHSHNFCLMQ